MSSGISQRIKNSVTRDQVFEFALGMLQKMSAQRRTDVDRLESILTILEQVRFVPSVLLLDLLPYFARMLARYPHRS